MLSPTSATPFRPPDGAKPMVEALASREYISMPTPPELDELVMQTALLLFGL